MADPRALDPAQVTLDAPFVIVPDIARFEPPDVVVFCPFRSMTVADVERVAVFARDLAERTGGIFTVSDATTSGVQLQYSLSAALEMNRQFNARQIRAAAAVGASFSMRTLSDTLMRAARLLKLEMASIPVRFFDDHASARAWFDELRNPSA